MNNNKLIVIFGRNHLPFSWLIRVFTWSRWSHCGVVVAGDTHVVEATAKHGVIITPIEEFKERYTDWQIAELPCDDVRLAHQRLKSQLGKKYDFGAIFGILLRTGWNIEDKWFCSELTAYAANTFREDRVGRITPEDIWSNSK